MSTRDENPTEQDPRDSKDLACKIADLLGEAEINIRFGALSLLVPALFATVIIEGYEVEAFDDFAKTVRESIQEKINEKKKSNHVH